MTDPQSRGWRFRPREAPDAAEHVQRSISGGAYDHVARVRIHAPKALVEKQIPASVGTVTAEGPDRCIFEAGGNHLGWMAVHLGALPWEMTVLDPPELRDVMREQAARMLRAAHDAGAGDAGDAARE
jgi:predicted DNA-binding transcriptional regulator YafY